MASLFPGLSGLIGLSSLGLVVVGTLTLARTLARQHKKQQRFNTSFEPVAVSILKPLKGLDAHLEENLKSFFEMTYASEVISQVELLFSVESVQDPAHAVVERLMKQYPEVHARLFLSKHAWADTVQLGMNPKLKNLIRSYIHASFDLILISDSNVRLQSGDLEDLVQKVLQNKVGMVTSIISGIEFLGWGGHLEATFLNTYLGRMMALSNRFAKPCVVGKSMMFKKSTAERFGGLKVLSEFLAEDYMAGESVLKLGLRVETASRSVHQIIGRLRFRQFWDRHLRWGRIRKAHVPLAYWLEPLSYFWIAMPMIYFCTQMTNPEISTLITLSAASLWFFCDAASYLLLVRPRTVIRHAAFPFTWLIREALALPLWICIGLRDRIEWRGNQLRLLPGGQIR
jgi:ceramide glucosyltransferase